MPLWRGLGYGGEIKGGKGPKEAKPLRGLATDPLHMLPAAASRPARGGTGGQGAWAAGRQAARWGGLSGLVWD